MRQPRDPRINPLVFLAVGLSGLAAATTGLFMDLAAGQFPNYPSGNTDDTHLQEKGARTISGAFGPPAGIRDRNPGRAEGPGTL